MAFILGVLLFAALIGVLDAKLIPWRETGKGDR